MFQYIDIITVSFIKYNVIGYRYDENTFNDYT